MQKRKAIRFQEIAIPEYAKESLARFMSEYPIAGSATKVVLATAVVGGILSAALVFPGVFNIAGKWLKQKERAKRERYRNIWRSFKRLKESNAVRLVGEDEKGEIYEFTDEGKKRLRTFLIETVALQKQKIWDGVWRIIIFDIPEQKRKARLAFQRKLDELGCYQLQKSIWAYPFPCEDEINFIAHFFGVKANVLILHTAEMPSGKTLYHFRHLLK